MVDDDDSDGDDFVLLSTGLRQRDAAAAANPADAADRDAAGPALADEVSRRRLPSLLHHW